MKCPKCKDRTDVLETRTTSVAIRRRRRCLNPHCEYRFTTTESAAAAPVVPVADEAAVRARALVKELGSRRVDNEALEAALAVDMRRAEIARKQREERRRLRDVSFDDGFDPAPDHLDEESLKRELGEF